MFRTKQTLVNNSAKVIPATSTEAHCQYLNAKIKIILETTKEKEEKNGFCEMIRHFRVVPTSSSGAFDGIYDPFR